MTPKQLERFLKSNQAWGQYLSLLNVSDARLKAKLQPIFQAMLSDPHYKPGDIMPQFYKNRMWEAVQQEKAFLRSAMNNPTADVFEAMVEASIDVAGALDPRVGLRIANAEIDAGVRIQRLIDNNTIKKTKLFGQVNKNLTGDKATAAVERIQRKVSRAVGQAIRLNELEGGAIGEVITDIRQNVIGLEAGQKVKGATAQIRTVVRTQAAALNYDIQTDVAMSDPNIVGVYIQRGPGPDGPADVCGVALGVAENEIGEYIYGVNDPPVLPIHPNCYGVIVGYVFKDDVGYQDRAEQWIADMKNPDKPGDYDTYKSFTKSHKSNKKALKGFADKIRREKEEAAA